MTQAVRGSGRVCVVEFGTVATKLRRCSGRVGSGRFVTPLHGPRTDSVCDPTRPPTHGHSPYMSRLSGQVYDRGTKSADPSGPWVGSGRVGVVEFGRTCERARWL